MAKLISIQNSFATGEVSFRIKGRVDNEKYGTGLDTAQNFRVLTQGPIERRNGSFLVGVVKDPNNSPRLLRFIISVTQSFVLEFGSMYVRFFTDTAAVEDSQNPGNVFELETPYTIEEVFQLQFSQAEFSLILTHVNHPQQELIFLASAPDDWTFEEFVPSPPPTFEEGFFPLGTLTASASTGLGVTFTSSTSQFSPTDVGRSIEGVGKIGIASVKSFTDAVNVVADIIEDFEPAFSYAPGEWLLDLSPLTDISFSDVTRSGGIVTVTSSPLADRTFRTSNIGDYILVNGGVLEILSLLTVQGQEVEAEILKSMESSDTTANWTLEVPTWSEERGFPATVTQAQQRLIFGGSLAQPQTVWASESGILNGFGVGALDDDSIEFDVLSNEISTIQWMRTARDLIIGTTGGESTINISTSRLTPDNVDITNRSSYKSDRQSPINIGSEVIFIQKGDRKILSYFFDFNSDTFKGDDLTFISEHITESGIRQLVYGQEPNSQIFAVTNSGILISGTYDREQKVIAFTRYTTAGRYLSVVAIPEGENDQIWVVVERRIDQTPRVFIEVFDESSGEDSADVFSDSAIVFSNPLTITSATNNVDATFLSIGHGLIVGDRIKFKDFSQWQDINQFIFTVTTVIDVDHFSCTYDSSGQPPYEGGAEVFKVVSSISGLEHLNGAVVEVKVDNAALTSSEPVIVVDGTVALGGEYAEVVIGLHYDTILITLPREFDIGLGSMAGQNKRLVKPILKVDRSYPPVVNGEIKPNRIPAFNMDEAEPLFTGDLEYSSDGWGTTAQIELEVRGPFPLRLLGIFGTVQGNVKGG